MTFHGTSKHSKLAKAQQASVLNPIENQCTHTIESYHDDPSYPLLQCKTIMNSTRHRTLEKNPMKNLVLTCMFFLCHADDTFMCWPFSGYRGKQLVQAVGDASKPSSIRPPPQGDKNIKSEERKTAGDTASSSKAKSIRPFHQGDNLVNSALEEGKTKMLPRRRVPGRLIKAMTS